MGETDVIVNLGGRKCVMILGGEENSV